jgi:hypothetical protein
MRRANAEQRILCLAARTELEPDVEARLIASLRGPVDWDTLLALATLHQVWPLLDLHIQRLAPRVAMPAEWVEQLHVMARATFFDNALMTQQLLRVLTAFADTGVPCIPFKGVILAQFVYGGLGLRPASDLDILVQRHDLPAARAVLHRLGFAQDPEADFGHLHHALHDAPYSYHVGGRHVRLDLHWTVWAPHLFVIDIERLWARAQERQLGGVPIRILTPEDRLLHLAIHRSRTALRLRLACDIAEVMRAQGASLDWDYLIDLAHRGGARTALYAALATAHTLLGAPLPPSILPRLKVSFPKRRLLAALWGSRAMFRPPNTNGAAHELTVAQRMVMLDDAPQVIRGLSYRSVRAVRYFKSLARG